KQVTQAQIHDCHPPSSLRNLSLFQMQKQLLLPAFQFPSKNTPSSLLTSPMTIPCSPASFNNDPIASASCSSTTNTIPITLITSPMTIACSAASFNNDTIASASCSSTTNAMPIPILNTPYISSNVILAFSFKN